MSLKRSGFIWTARTWAEKDRPQCLKGWCWIFSVNVSVYRMFEARFLQISTIPYVVLMMGGAYWFICGALRPRVEVPKSAQRRRCRQCERNKKEFSRSGRIAVATFTVVTVDVVIVAIIWFMGYHHDHSVVMGGLCLSVFWRWDELTTAAVPRSWGSGPNICPTKKQLRRLKVLLTTFFPHFLSCDFTTGLFSLPT